MRGLSSDIATYLVSRNSRYCHPKVKHKVSVHKQKSEKIKLRTTLGNFLAGNPAALYNLDQVVVNSTINSDGLSVEAISVGSTDFDPSSQCITR